LVASDVVNVFYHRLHLYVGNNVQNECVTDPAVAQVKAELAKYFQTGNVYGIEFIIDPNSSID
jgi:hypothetical protein